MRAITRGELCEKFLEETGTALLQKGLAKRAEELYETLQEKNIAESTAVLDAFILKAHQQQQKGFDESALVAELYKLKFYDWGGDYKNSLDRYLVDDFIKVYPSYDHIISKLDTEIQRSVQGYVLCSWYNHWSSILIENIFKSHHAVLPAIGQIKKVDFFVRQIPFDLKATYLPANFIEAKRKSYGLKPELTELKQQAKRLEVQFETHRKSDDTYYELIERLRDRNTAESLRAIEAVREVRLKILEETMANPKDLIRNLYEQQGETRFDAANRMFLILVDAVDFDSSWKLKRDLDLLRPTIQAHLDTFSEKRPETLRTEFDYGGNRYQCLADCIFVVRR